MSDRLETISYLVDDFIAEIVQATNIDPLSISAIVLARLVLTNDYAGSGQQFRELARSISEHPPHRNETIQ